MHESGKKQSVITEPLDFAELKAERNELREAVKNFETELMQVIERHTYNAPCCVSFVSFDYRFKWMLKILLATGTTLKYYMNKQVVTVVLL